VSASTPRSSAIREHGPSVTRTYYAIACIYTLSASLIWGVNTLFLLDAGLDIFEVFVANAAFTAGMVIFEIPTGVTADTRGRRFSFLLSALTIMVGTIAYVSIAAVGGGLVPFVVASIVLGLGFSFYSGAVEARKKQAMAFELSPFDQKLLKFGTLFRERFMDIRVSIPVVEALDLCWKTLAECFDSQELLMKQSIVDKYFPKKDGELGNPKH